MKISLSVAQEQFRAIDTAFLAARDDFHAKYVESGKDFDLTPGTQCWKDKQKILELQVQYEAAKKELNKARQRSRI